MEVLFFQMEILFFRRQILALILSMSFKTIFEKFIPSLFILPANPPA